MRKRALGSLVGGLLLAAGVPGVGMADGHGPDENQIMVEEIPAIAQRATFMSFPDEESALDSLATMDDGAQDVIAMHLGRLHPNQYETTPGVAPLIDLIRARADLAVSPAHWEKKLADYSNGEFAVIMLPVDATIVIIILPTQVVRSNPVAAELPQRDVDLSGLTYEYNGQTRTLEDYMADGATNAIGFMYDGDYIYEDFQNGFDPLTRHQMWSVTKSVTTTLVGIAVDEGLIDIEDPVTDYLPEVEGTVWATDMDGNRDPVTIEDLLQMESGTYWVDVPVHQPEELIYMGMDFHTNGLYGATRDEYLDNMTRTSPRGEFYRYNSGDPQMLTRVLETVYAKPYSQILSEKIWIPAGMQDDALVMVDRTGDAFASMGLFATTRDMARFGEMIRVGGVYNGNRIVSEEWIAKATLHSPEGDPSGGGPRAYMWPEFMGDLGYTASGYGHQKVAVVPDWKMVGVRFGNDPADMTASGELEAVYAAIHEHMVALDAG